MPRALAPGRRQHPTNVGHRDLRHENGLVGPGKRASSKKSNSTLEGPARRSEHDAALAGPLAPSLAPNGDTNGTVLRNRADAASAAAVAASGLEGRPVDIFRRGSLGTCSEDSSESYASSFGVNGMPTEVGHRKIDVNAMKNADVHRDSGPLYLAATVVKSLPIQDTLAILIILMHLPYLSLTLVYALFASLSFAPTLFNRAGWNVNFGDILEGSFHHSSIMTVVCMDFIFFLIWIFLWPPIQYFMLEFAKPVIAVTLGGGTSAKDGSSRGVTACFTWVLLTRMFRATKAHLPRVAPHLPEAWPLPAIIKDSLYSTSSTYDKKDTQEWVQSVLAIHILVQGLVRYIREWYIKREKYSSNANAGDPEAGNESALPSSETTTVPQTLSPSEPVHEIGHSNFFEIDGQLHVASATKRKKKQGLRVRLRQPLWAALARTKIVALKEYEFAKWTDKAGGFSKRDVHHYWNDCSSENQLKQIWISFIGSDEFSFHTSLFPAGARASGTPSAQPADDAAKPVAADAPKPFFVRINNAFWQLIRFYRKEASDVDCRSGCQWYGDIYGLRPASKYVCEFVDSQTGGILSTSIIRTRNEPLRDHNTHSPLLPEGQQVLRPDSPSTTLRTSIAAADAKLIDERSRLKLSRKEWKMRLNVLKKENELAQHQLSSAGNSDEKYKQKIRQQETQKGQAERDAERLGKQLAKMETTSELDQRHSLAQESYSAQKTMFDVAQKELAEIRLQMESKIKAKETETSNLNTRRNKVAARVAKVEAEMTSMMDASNRGVDEAQRRERERKSWREQATVVENSLSERLASTMVVNKRRLEQLQKLQDQIQGLHGFAHPPGMAMAETAPSLLAEKSRASAHHLHTWNAQAAGPSRFSSGAWTSSSGNVRSPFLAPSLPSTVPVWPASQQQPSMADLRSAARARGRSSSMLSDISGFTQGSDEGVEANPGGPRVRPLPSAQQRDTASGHVGDNR